MNTKKCANCGTEFARLVTKNCGLQRIADWERKKYCSTVCRTTAPAYREKQRSIALAKGYGQWMTGKKASEETRQKISKAHVGHHRGGWKLPLEVRTRMSESKRGDKCHLWKGGITPKNAAARMTMEYRAWRRSVLERDDFTCVHCGQRGGKLHVDHIVPFAAAPERRLDINNGRTLCVPCHKATPTYLKRWAVERARKEAAYQITITEVAA